LSTPRRDPRHWTLTATALIAGVGNGTAFRKGRESCSLGWAGAAVNTPRRQTENYSHQQRGNGYLRRLFGRAHARLQFERSSLRLSAWLAQLAARAHHKRGRRGAERISWRAWAWAVLAKGEVYRPPLLASGLACR